MLISCKGKIGPEAPTEVATTLHRHDKIYGVVYNGDVAQVTVTGSLPSIVDAAQQLAWLTAAYRVPIEGQASYSDVHLADAMSEAELREIAEGLDPRLKIFRIVPLPLEAMPDTPEAPVPQDLKGKIIVRGFPVPAKSER